MLANDTSSAWTTGPCLAVSGANPLSEDLLRYTPRGGKGEFPVTAAVNVAYDKQELEADRKLKAHSPAEHVYVDLVTLEGTLKLRSFEPRAVEIHLSVPLAGKPIKASDDGRLAVDPTKLKLTVDAEALLATDTTSDPPVVSMNQRARGKQEFRQRARYVQSNSVLTQNATQIEGPAVASSDLGGGIMTPVWLDGRLLLARRVLLRAKENLQICRLDWPAVDSWLISLVRDLLSEARLTPAPAGPEDQPSRRLAALPVVLDPGNLPAVAAARWSPLGWSLVVAWVCVVLAALAVAVLLSTVVSLSERRAAFVAAVTHELRTPLTTFRMYAEMLAENMVSSETDRRAYLDTLRGEADRLTHLVENVLSYARLERGRTVGARETVSIATIIERVEDRLAARARQADMQLVVEVSDEVRRETLHTDVASIEQILFNLVDNACKYAAGSSDRRIHLVAGVADRLVQLRVADHGPGVAPVEARRLFQPFAKSAEDAARTAPGVGLGLALSRRLARQLGGRLDLEMAAGYGGCFVLSLPRSTLGPREHV